MNLRKPTEKKALSFLRAWYLVGIIGFSLPFTFSWFRYLTPFSLLLLAGLFWIYHPRGDRKFLLVIGLVFLAGYGVEVAGVHTGKIFGIYQYGPTLGPKLAGVPLIIGLNWLIMVYGALALVAPLHFNTWGSSFLAAVIMTSSDYFLEKFALLSNMWSWQSGQPPLQNYASWFILSFLFSLLVHSHVAGKSRTVAIHGYLYQFCFMILILLIHRLFWP